MGKRRRYQGLQRWGLQECSLPDLEDGGHSFRQSGERTRQTRRTRPAQTGSTRTHLCQTLGTGVFLAGRSPFPAHTEQDTGTQRKERAREHASRQPAGQRGADAERERHAQATGAGSQEA